MFKKNYWCLLEFLKTQYFSLEKYFKVELVVYCFNLWSGNMVDPNVENKKRRTQNVQNWNNT